MFTKLIPVTILLLAASAIAQAQVVDDPQEPTTVLKATPISLAAPQPETKKSLSPELVSERYADGVLKIDPVATARIDAYFQPPDYEQLADHSDELRILRDADPAFDAWLLSNVDEHQVSGYAIVNLSLKAPGKIPGDLSAAKGFSPDALARELTEPIMGKIGVRFPCDRELTACGAADVPHAVDESKLCGAHTGAPAIKPDERSLGL